MKFCQIPFDARDFKGFGCIRPFCCPGSERMQRQMSVRNARRATNLFDVRNLKGQGENWLGGKWASSFPQNFNNLWSSDADHNQSRLSGSGTRDPLTHSQRCSAWAAAPPLLLVLMKLKQPVMDKEQLCPRWPVETSIFNFQCSVQNAHCSVNRACKSAWILCRPRLRTAIANQQPQC